MSSAKKGKKPLPPQLPPVKLRTEFMFDKTAMNFSISDSMTMAKMRLFLARKTEKIRKESLVYLFRKESGDFVPMCADEVGLIFFSNKIV